MAPMHFAVGIAGLLAWRNVWSPLTYAQVLGGFSFRGANTMFRLVPIFAHDAWLHAFSAAPGIYLGWLYRPLEVRTPSSSVMA